MHMDAQSTVEQDTIEAKRLLADANAALNDRKLNEAASLARDAMDIFAKYPQDCARRHYNAASIFITSQIGLRKYKQARVFADSLVEYANVIPYGNEMELADAKLNLGICLIERGKFDEAISALYESRRHFQADSAVLNKYEPRLLTEIGIAKRKQRSTDEAINFYSKAVELYVKQGDKIGLAKCYHNLGNAYYDDANLIRARQHYQKALETFPEQFELNKASSYEGVALTYRKVSAYGYSIENLEQAQEIYTRRFGPDHKATIRMTRKIAHNYLRMGDVERAIGMLRKLVKSGTNSVATLAEAYMENDQLDSAFYIIKNLMSLPSATTYDSAVQLDLGAKIFERKGDFKQARTLHEKSLKMLIRALRPNDDRITEAQISFASLDGLAGNYESSIRALDTILQAGVNMTHVAEGADTLRSQLWFDVLEKQLSFRFEQYKKLESQEERSNLKAIILNKGDEYLVELAKIRENVSSIQRSYSINEGSKRVIRILLSVLYAAVNSEEDNTWQMARVQDEMRDLLWHDFVKNAGIVSMSGIESERLAYESEIRKQIAELELLKQIHPDSTAIADQTMVLKSEIAKKPTPTKSKIIIPDDEKLQEIIFQDHDALLSYFIADKFLYRIYINRSQRKVDTLAWNNEIVEEIEKLSSKLSDPSATDWMSSATVLADHILSGIDLDQQEHLLIFPDQALWLIPFEVLPLGNEGQLLIDRHVITYSSSLKKYIHGKQGRPESQKKEYDLIGFVPSYDAIDEDMDPNAVRGDELLALPSAKKEMDAITQYIKNSHAFLGGEATVETFISALGKSKILHLPMHAIADISQPELSHLVFSSRDTSNPMSRYLFASEIAVQRIPEELVVLSACNTGTGKFVQGEGVQSLARSFEYAGVRSSIFSLWRIPDAASSEVMSSFYSNLTKKQSKSTALRNAKRAFRKRHHNSQFDHPFYWSGFVFSGNPDELHLGSSMNIWINIAVAIAIYVLILLWFRRKKSRAL